MGEPNDEPAEEQAAIQPDVDPEPPPPPTQDVGIEVPDENPETEPEYVPPAVIKAAQYDYDGKSVILIITEPSVPEQHTYALNTTDENGLSPFLREELQRMVDAGEIEIQAAPPAPQE